MEDTGSIFCSLIKEATTRGFRGFLAQRILKLVIANSVSIQENVTLIRKEKASHVH